MGRPKKVVAKVPEVPETEEIRDMLFPELERTNPAHRELFKIAQDFGRKKQAHATGIAELKGLRYSAEKKLIAKMHELKLTGFIFDGIKVNIEIGDEKALIKISESEDQADKNEINPE